MLWTLHLCNLNCTRFKTLNYRVSECEHTEGQMQRDDIQVQVQWMLKLSNA